MRLVEVVRNSRAADSKFGSGYVRKNEIRLLTRAWQKCAHRKSVERVIGVGGRGVGVCGRWLREGERGREPQAPNGAATRTVRVASVT